MAADVTLVALANTPSNWTAAKLKTYQEYFDDDLIFYYDDRPPIVGHYSGSSLRSFFNRDFYNNDNIRWFEIGRTDQEAPCAVEDLCAKPRLNDSSFRTQCMVALNMPGKAAKRQKVLKWLNAHNGYIVFAEAW